MTSPRVRCEEATRIESVHEFIVALSGSFEVMVDDGTHRVRYALNRSYQALVVPNLIWRRDDQLLNEFGGAGACLRPILA